LNSALPPIDREKARVRHLEVPHQRPAAQEERVELALAHQVAHGAPAAIALGERNLRQREGGFRLFDHA
jgi:hypothetical protein